MNFSPQLATNHAEFQCGSFPGLDATAIRKAPVSSICRPWFPGGDADTTHQHDIKPHTDSINNWRYQRAASNEPPPSAPPPSDERPSTKTSTEAAGLT